MSILPLLAALALQFVCGMAVSVWGIFVYGMTEGVQWYMDHMTVILLAVNLLLLLFMGLWYYLLALKKRPEGAGRREAPFTWKSAGIILCIAISLQCLISVLLAVWQYLDPKQIEAYAELIEQSGIGTLTLFSAIATVVMAPIAEELVFRGVVIEYLKRTGAGFWVINGIQALFFGIYHLNLVQGVYAFIMGLACGYLALKYRTLLASVCLHMAFNAYATFLSPLLEMLESSMPAAYYAVTLIVGLVLVILGLRWLKKDIAMRDADTSKMQTANDPQVMQ